MNANNRQRDLGSYAEPLNKVPACKRRDDDADWFPAVDVSDAGAEYLFEFDLPGLAREEVQIRLDGDALLLVGTRMSSPSGGTSLRVERPVGAFVRRLALPPDSSSDEIYVTLQEGVLKLHVPKNTPRKEKEESATHYEEPDYECPHH
jgi:HSP20 family protein